METRDRSKAQTLKSLDLALRLLGSFSSARRERGVTELARDFGVSKATIYRTLVTLERHRYVAQNPVTGRYRLGPRLGQLIHSAGPRLDLGAEARPYMEQVRERTKETVHLDVLDGKEVVVTAKLDGLQTVQVMSKVGNRGPAHCVSTGKVILAYGEPYLFDRVVADGLARYTERTHDTVGSLSRELAQIREAGFAVNWAEWREEAHGIAAPVVDSSLQVVAALGICGPSARLVGSVVSANAAAVADAARRLSIHLGAPEGALEGALEAGRLAAVSSDRGEVTETGVSGEGGSQQRSA